MAGIGFVLRKLAQKESLTGTLQAYLNSGLAICGPWIFTIIALGCFQLVTQPFAPKEALLYFKSVIIHNFSFSLILASPFTVIATRFLSDCIYKRNLEEGTGLLLESLTLVWIISLPFALFFYAGFAEFSFPLAYSATLNFLLLSGIWVATVFISTLKNYGAITSTFLVGILVSYSATLWLAEDSTPSDLILAFSTGPLFIFCSLLANIMSEYPKLLKFPCHATAYFRTYWDIALGGFFYSLAIWVDKWIMWFSPEASHAIPHLPSYPTYNTALFISYLSVVPAMALFMYDLETEFFDIYVKFYRDIQDHANLRKIQQNYLGIMRAVASSCRNILVLQAAICLLSLTMAPKIFELLHLPYLQLSMFRYGLLGASFQLFTLLLTIFLAYFEFRRQTMWVFFIFFISNTLFTLLTLRLGFPFYGTGYFLSTVLTFGVAAFVTEKKMQNLLYHSFVTNNDAILRSR